MTAQSQAAAQEAAAKAQAESQAAKAPAPASSGPQPDDKPAVGQVRYTRNTETGVRTAEID